VSIDGTFIKTLTDNDGVYHLKYQQPGTVFLTVSKNGFYDAHSNDVEVSNDGSTVTENISISSMPSVTVTGTIIGSDTQAGVAGAVVSLTGYADYLNITTNAQGLFSIPNVYYGDVGDPFYYTITVTATGYNKFTQAEIPVSDTQMDIGTFTIIEKAPLPHHVTANLTGSIVNLSWNTPGTGTNRLLTHSSDNYWNAWSFENADITGAARFSPAHLAAKGAAGAVLTKVYFAVYDLPVQAFVYIWVDGTSITNPGTLVHTQEIDPASFASMQFIEVVLDNPVYILPDAELRIGIRCYGDGWIIFSDGQTAIEGYSDLICANLTNWMTTTSQGYSENIMIKGYNRTWIKGVGVIAFECCCFGNNHYIFI
jgi:hypothetical protein